MLKNSDEDENNIEDNVEEQTEIPNELEINPSNWQKSYKESSNIPTIQNRNHWATGYDCGFVDFLHLQPTFDQQQIVDFFNCFNYSDFNWTFRMFGNTGANANIS